jgi:hypothetical protein
MIGRWAKPFVGWDDQNWDRIGCQTDRKDNVLGCYLVLVIFIRGTIHVYNKIFPPELIRLANFLA